MAVESLCWECVINQCAVKLPGEILRMTHVARGLDTDGTLLLDVVVSGHVLQLQSVADVNVKVKLLHASVLLSPRGKQETLSPATCSTVCDFFCAWLN